MANCIVPYYLSQWSWYCAIISLINAQWIVLQYLSPRLITSCYNIFHQCSLYRATISLTTVHYMVLIISYHWPLYRATISLTTVHYMVLNISYHWPLYRATISLTTVHYMVLNISYHWPLYRATISLTTVHYMVLNISYHWPLYRATVSLINAFCIVLQYLSPRFITWFSISLIIDHCIVLQYLSSMLFVSCYTISHIGSLYHATLSLTMAYCVSRPYLVMSFSLTAWEDKERTPKIEEIDL